MSNITRDVKELVLRNGADLVGIAPAEGWDAPKGHDPKDIMPHAQSVAVIGIRLLDWIIDHGPAKARIDHHDFVLSMVDKVGFEVGRWLSDKGFDAYPVNRFVGFESEIGALSQGARTGDWFKAIEKDPSFRIFMYGEIPLALAGYKAGLGAIGRFSLLITPRFGPRVVLGAVITNAPLEADKPLEVDFCKDCYVCAKTCLGQAISDQGYDVAKCWRAELEHGENVMGVSYRP
jgi:epoxyqueuosine reductase